jgi:hypothetical protein
MERGKGTGGKGTGGKGREERRGEGTDGTFAVDMTLMYTNN